MKPLPARRAIIGVGAAAAAPLYVKVCRRRRTPMRKHLSPNGKSARPSATSTARPRRRRRNRPHGGSLASRNRRHRPSIASPIAALCCAAAAHYGSSHLVYERAHRAKQCPTTKMLRKRMVSKRPRCSMAGARDRRINVNIRRAAGST